MHDYIYPRAICGYNMMFTVYNVVVMAAEALQPYPPGPQTSGNESRDRGKYARLRVRFR